MKSFLRVVVTVGILFFLAIQLHAQKLVADVSIILERLPLENQKLLENLAEDLETYINDFDYTDDNSYEQGITINIYLMDNSVSYEDRYAGTFLISNNSDLQYHDKYWRFPLQEGYQFNHVSGIYDPFTGFIDYYIYLILAGEMDKYGKFLGTPFYEKAKQLADQAMFNATFSIGWKERQELIKFLMGPENKKFREMKDFYFMGLSYWEEDDVKARQYCKQAINMLEDVLTENSEHEGAMQFLKAHHIEMIELFLDDPKVMRQLIRIDPERKSTYEQYL